VVANTVAAPVEQQVNGVEGMMYMSSQCTNDGAYSLTVTFRQGTDLNLAQVLVQNRVALAQPILPGLVRYDGAVGPGEKMARVSGSTAGQRGATDGDGRPMILFGSEWALEYCERNNPGVQLLAVMP